jgi:hypothetical protein
MFRRTFGSAVLLTFAATAAAVAAPSIAKWPPWLSIESPVNPYDPSTRGAAMLIHARFREGPARLADLSGTAEGIVGGQRRSIPLRFDSTGYPNTFVLRRQWPTAGTWLLRIALRSTTAIVTLDRSGDVASVRVPTEPEHSGGIDIPRAVSAREIDSALAAAARR